MRRQANESIKMFLRSCIAKVAQILNMKCSGTRLEVSGYRLAEQGRVGEEEEMRMKGHCYVHERLQCHSRGLWEQFSAFFNFI